MGPDTLHAVFTPAQFGDYSGSTGTTSFVVSAAGADPTTTAASVNPTAVTFGQSVTYSAVVSGVGTPTGSVAFSIGAVHLCTGAQLGLGLLSRHKCPGGIGHGDSHLLRRHHLRPLQRDDPAVCDQGGYVHVPVGESDHFGLRTVGRLLRGSQRSRGHQRDATFSIGATVLCSGTLATGLGLLPRQ